MTSRERDEQSSIFQVADRIRRLGLQSPALIALEAGRPLTFLAAQLIWLAQPALALLASRGEVTALAELMEDPESVNALIDLLGREHGESRGGA